MSEPDPATWRAVRSLFEEIVELPPAERPAALAARCGGDAGLRRAVEELLAGDARAGVLGDAPAVQLPPPEDPLRAGEAGGAVVIGGFTVRRLLGSGGMGAVYEAEQAQPRRAVALKVLRPELCTGATLRRFEAEAEILARLRHPGIAQVFAAGLHEVAAGPFRWQMPWYAMELLAGARPLTAHARQADLDVRSRLELFGRVCAAVQHAHHNGVIHRDLKPGNVLVDASGTPKVIDFGVARAAGDDAAQHTEAGVVLGTPAYMAPEQFAGDSARIDARCDVWALGVLLWELLTGELPFALDTRRLDDAPRVLAAGPRSLRSLRPELAVELDWIVRRALAVESERRYQTVAALAADVAGFLRGDPVLAAPDSRVYRLKTTLRRHRTLVLGLTAVLVALGAGLVSTAVALARAKDAEATALAEKTIAQAERNVAQRESERHGGLVAVLRAAVRAARGRHAGADATVADLCAELEATAQGGADLPLFVRAAVLEHLATLESDNGAFARAEALYRRALDLLRDGGLLGDEPEIVTRNALAAVLLQQGSFAAAEQELAAAIALGEKALAADHPLRDSLQRRRSFVLSDLGRHEEAIALGRELIARRRARHGADAPQTAESLADLVVLLIDGQRLEEAEAAGIEAIAACRAAYGPADRKTLNLILNHSTTLLKLRRFAEIEPAVHEAILQADASLGPGHPVTVTLRENVGQALTLGGRPRDAIPILEDCLRLQADMFPAHHPEVLGGASMLARAHLVAGEAEQAHAIADGHRHGVASGPPAVEGPLLGLQTMYARALAALGRRAEAVAELSAAYERGSAVLGAGHPNALAAARELADWCAREGRVDDAAGWRARAESPGR